MLQMISVYTLILVAVRLKMAFFAACADKKTTLPF